ncbi:MAG: dihydrofolate reductase family protein [Ilumatobacter sp.]|uniref:dihydrofolate reductase family protein n=1 Tax=Ilumatobacter sp. TaxID=1967498 RepID=UPI003298AA7F
MRSLTYHVAVSIDGYIADPDGSFDAFAQTGDHIDALIHDVPETLPGHVLSALGVDATNDTYDTVLMGWNTFAVGLPHGIDDPYPHLRQYVFSRTRPPGDVGGDVHLVADDPIELVRELKSESSTKDIWLCGGGALAGALRDEIDRLVLKVNPVLLGSGIPLFEPEEATSRPFVLESTRSFDTGVHMASYRAGSRRETRRTIDIQRLD